MDLLIPICSAIAVVLVAMVAVLTIAIPMLLGLFGGRRRETTRIRP